MRDHLNLQYREDDRSRSSPENEEEKKLIFISVYPRVFDIVKVSQVEGNSSNALVCKCTQLMISTALMC
jgi:hypothetical protein